MLTRLLASTAVAALIASGAYAQSTESEDTQIMEQHDELGLQGNEIVVRSGDTIVVDSADAEFTLRLSKDASASSSDMVASQSTDMDGATDTDSAAMEGSDADSEMASAPDSATDDLASDETAAAAPDEDSSTADRVTADISGQDVVVSDGDILLVDSNAGSFQLNFEIRDASDMSAATDSMQGEQDAQTANVENETIAVDETDDTVTSAIEREGMHARTLDQIRADELIGSTIYGANDENIGSVGDVLLTQDGQVDAVLVDVGGFLGIGTREVAIGIDDVQFMVDDNEKWYVYSPFTEEQLEAHPAYDAATYADQREEQRLIVR